MYQRIADLPEGEYQDREGNRIRIDKANKQHPDKAGYAYLCPASAWAAGSKVYRPVRDPNYQATSL